MRRAFALSGAILAASALAGCGTLRPPQLAPTTNAPVAETPSPAPAPRTVRVYVPKIVKCVPEDLGPAPTYPDTDEALRDAGGAADRYQLLAAGRILREERLRKLEEVVKRCRSGSR